MPPSVVPTAGSGPSGEMAQPDRRHVRTIVAGALAALLVLVAAVGLLALRTRTWTAQSRVLVQPVAQAEPDTTASYYDILIRGQVTTTYAQLLNDQRSVSSALRDAGISADSVAADRVQVTVVAGTTLLSVTSTAPTAEAASRATDAVAAAAVAQIAGLRDPFEARVVGPASADVHQEGALTLQLVVVSLTVAGAVGLAVQQLLHHREVTRGRWPGSAVGPGVVPDAGGHDAPVQGMFDEQRHAPGP